MDLSSQSVADLDLIRPDLWQLYLLIVELMMD